MNVLRTPLAAAILMASAACASAPPKLNDNLIVPGERVGNVELGMTLAELFNRRGAPSRTIPIPGTSATTYYFDGLMIAADDKVYWIIARDPRYRTAYGVTTGSEQIFARGTYGKPKCVVTEGDVTTYDYDDIYFEVDNASGKVEKIGILRQTKTCN